MTPETAAAVWAKSIVGAAAIAAIVALAIAKIVTGPDAIAFTRWVLLGWMGSLAVASAGGAIAKAMTQKTDATSAAQTTADTLAHVLVHNARLHEALAELRTPKKDP